LIDEPKKQANESEADRENRRFSDNIKEEGERNRRKNSLSKQKKQARNLLSTTPTMKGLLSAKRRMTASM
jgi:hypothetical protein